MIHACLHCEFKSKYAWVVRRHADKKHAVQDQQFIPQQSFLQVGRGGLRVLFAAPLFLDFLCGRQPGFPPLSTSPRISSRLYCTVRAPAHLRSLGISCGLCPLKNVKESAQEGGAFGGGCSASRGPLFCQGDACHRVLVVP